MEKYKWRKNKHAFSQSTFICPRAQNNPEQWAQVLGKVLSIAALFRTVQEVNEERLDLVDYICSEHKFTDVRAFLAVCVGDHLEINDIKLHSRLFSNI